METRRRAVAWCVLMNLFNCCSIVHAAPRLRVLQGASQPPDGTPTIQTSPNLNLDAVDNASIIATPTVSYGLPASPGDFPYLGFMNVTYAYDAFGNPQFASCACTHIAPRVALTAGKSRHILRNRLIRRATLPACLPACLPALRNFPPLLTLALLILSCYYYSALR